MCSFLIFLYRYGFGARVIVQCLKLLSEAPNDTGMGKENSSYNITVMIDPMLDDLKGLYKMLYLLVLPFPAVNLNGDK